MGIKDTTIEEMPPEVKGVYHDAAGSQLEHVGGAKGLQAIINGENPFSLSANKHVAISNVTPNNAIFRIISEEEAKVIAERINAARPEGVDPATVEQLIGMYIKSMLNQTGLTFYGAAMFKKKTLSVFEKKGILYTLEQNNGHVCLRRITTKKVKLVKADSPVMPAIEP